ncbi:hypothetical protein CO660_25155 [Rhizobium sp. L9]|nr:hypothetical protein CO660_25155 [Rhizobium sp. L9]
MRDDVDVWIGSDDAFPVEGWRFSFRGYGVCPAEDVGNKAGGAIFAFEIGIGRCRRTGEPET